MYKIDNEWFLQKDLIHRIDGHINYSEGYTLIYESIDNAFEHFVYYPIPIPVKKINSIMNYETWGENFDLTKQKILLFNGSHYLSLSFRRHFKIELHYRKYFSESQKEYSKLEVDESQWSKSKKCYILTEALIEYLSSTKQILLYGIRSHRHSERNLVEYDLKTFGDKIKSSVKNYSWHVQSVQDRGSTYHKQINSMSIVFGKYFVPIT